MNNNFMWAIDRAVTCALRDSSRCKQPSRDRGFSEKRTATVHALTVAHC